MLTIVEVVILFYVKYEITVFHTNYVRKNCQSQLKIVLYEQGLKFMMTCLEQVGHHQVM